MNNLFRRFMENYNRRKKFIASDGIKSYLLNTNGYILLIVLIISAFLVSFTSDFFFQTSIYISSLKRARANLECEYTGLSGLEIAKAIIEIDRLGMSTGFLPNLNNNRNIDSYMDIWALDFPEFPILDGTVKISIEDENSKININALISEFAPSTKYYGILQRFFVNMGLPMDIADAIIDWVDPDDSRFPYGAESSGYYQTLSPPYKAKNAPADSIDELLLVKGITPEIYYGLGGGNYGLEKNLVEHNKGDVTLPEEKLEDLNAQPVNGSEDDNEPITAGKEKDRRLDKYLRVYGEWMKYPDESSRININTASYRVLISLTDEISDETVQEIIKKRNLEPFKTVDEISAFTGKGNTVNSLLTVKSHIFKITVTSVNLNGKYKSVYYYDRDNKKILYCSGEY
ncbi:MAG: general secretion pathway protein GspK [Spirochaetes bacterium]|nr:general secretion pathway protein GspK [Spirochaetota bacterium]